MTWTRRLEVWFQAEKAAGRVVDVKFFPGLGGPDGSIERHSKAVLETLLGLRETQRLDTSDL